MSRTLRGAGAHILRAGYGYFMNTDLILTTGRYPLLRQELMAD